MGCRNPNSKVKIMTFIDNALSKTHSGGLPPFEGITTFGSALPKGVKYD